MMLFKSNGGKVAAALRQIAAEYPREFPRILSTVGLGLRKKVSAAMPNGAPPLRFSPWNSFTRLIKTLRLRRYRTSDKYKQLKSGLRRKKSGQLYASSKKKLTSSRPSWLGFGGLLATDRLLRFKKRKDSVSIGWIDGRTAEYAQSFQTKRSRALTKEERHFRHKIQGENIDRTYTRPARTVMEPFAKDPATSRYIVDAAQKRLVSIIEKNTAKVSGAVA